MAILVFTELANGVLRKTSIEVAAFSAALAKENDTKCIAIAIGNCNPGELEKLGNFGIEKVLHADAQTLNAIQSKAYALIISDVAKGENIKDIILSHNSTGRTIAPRIAIKMKQIGNIHIILNRVRAACSNCPVHSIFTPGANVIC